MALTAKRRKFIEEYLQCWNATEAARRADYAHPNVQGPRLLVNVSVKAEIQRRLQEAAMSADEVLSRLSDQARTDIGEYIIAKGGNLVLNWDEFKAAGLTHLIKSITPTRAGDKIEFHDAQTALVQMGRAHGVFKDKQVRELSPEAVKVISQLAALVSEYVPEDKRDELKEALQQWVED